MLDTIDLRHIKEAYNIEWDQFLGPFLGLNRHFKFILVAAQTKIKRASLTKLLETPNSKLEVVLI